MKALILAGGSGTRLRPLTYSSAKQLVPVANKPILFYGIEDMAAAGITDIGIIIGDTGEEIRAAVGDGSRWGVDITYICQEEPLGLAHCVLIARDFLGDDPFVMYLGDNMLEEDLAGFVDEFDAAAGPAARVLLAKVENPASFGVAALDGDGRVVGLVEKPADPPSDLALVGVYLFTSHVHEAVRSIKPSARGELEITDAIQWLLDRDLDVDHRILEGWWIDTGKKDPLLECNCLILESITTDLAGEVDARSTLEGEVRLAPGATIRSSKIFGPVVIGSGTTIENSTIGPYASIGEGCHLDDVVVDHSVLLPDVRIAGPLSLTDSLVGRQAVITGGAERHRLMVGDHCTIEVP